MSGVAPSSDAAGSSVAGTPGTPTRSSFRIWASAGFEKARKSVRMRNARSIDSRDIRIFYTWNRVCTLLVSRTTRSTALYGTELAPRMDMNDRHRVRDETRRGRWLNGG
jgi:hypothetical protein